MGRSSDAKPRILAAAAELFQAQGFHAAGVGEVCRRAGVQKGSFYHFFPSKRQLALEVIDDAWERHRELLDTTLGGSGPPAERFRRFLAESARRQREAKVSTGRCPGSPFSLLALEMSGQDAAIEERLIGVLEDQLGYFRRLLEGAAAAPPEAEPRARRLLALVEGTLMEVRLRNDPTLLDGLEAVLRVGL